MSMNALADCLDVSRLGRVMRSEEIATFGRISVGEAHRRIEKSHLLPEEHRLSLFV